MPTDPTDPPTWVKDNKGKAKDAFNQAANPSPAKSALPPRPVPQPPRPIPALGGMKVPPVPKPTNLPPQVPKKTLPTVAAKTPPRPIGPAFNSAAAPKKKK